MIAYLDLPSGLAGDIFLACLVDAGWNIASLQQVIDSLGLPERCLVTSSRVMRQSVQATHLDVTAPDSHHHRHLHHIATIINASRLSPSVKARALAVFQRLAVAEARVHGTTPEKIHFHEVGALDAIIDIVGVCAGLEALGIEKLYASGVPLGYGWVESQHGLIPVPAPATLEILATAGIPTRLSPGGGELLTPTGAALLAELAEFTQPPMRIARIANGAGTRNPAWPNVARLLLGEPAATPSSADASNSLVEMQTNIDDMNPQLYEPAMQTLFDAGALDVWLVNVQMKKNRPGVVLHVLAKSSDESTLAGILLRQTTTLGVRTHSVSRHIAQREFRSLSTPYGDLTLKLKILDGRIVDAVPEFDDCRRLAAQKQIPVKQVLDSALALAQTLKT